ncbi:MAG TPA: copper resistance protein B [Methylophaga aminisulfidivorans]|nr:copper resistance protein B [Methylophaga aminisulfidivorans]
MKKLVMSVFLSIYAIPAFAYEMDKSDMPKMGHTYYTGKVSVDRLELARDDNDKTTAIWDVLAWYGGDIHRVYVKSEGENTQHDGKTTVLESAEVLYSRLIAPFWELQAGVGTRGELGSRKDMENYAAFSLYGKAPYRFEVDTTLRVNDYGDISMNSEVEYDIRLTQISYLQPRMEVSASLTPADEYDRPRGFNNLQLGLRYRYELSREFAPYIGVYWQTALGNSADILRKNNEDVDTVGVVLGTKFWF